jgi:Patatin-like phospholipase
MSINIFHRLHIPVSVAMIVWLLMLTGCTGPIRRDAVPDALFAKAEVAGLKNIRYCPEVEADLKAMSDEGIASFYAEKAFYISQEHKGALPAANYLAISGGGDKGAFGAGLLLGWTARGDRPEFKLVTGVSTGALIAPFAFLGPRYDQKLKAVYTGVTQADILEERGITAAIWEDAMADNRPLGRLLDKYIDRRMLEDIAAQYKKGRLLLVATTNLDSQVPVIWNLTKIAASGKPGSLDLFRSLMIASAAIPGAFPPVLIDVTAEGQPYQEMHVDGGATTQVFLYPPALRTAKLLEDRSEHRERRLFIIRNARLDHDWTQVERRTLPIIQKAITSLIQTQGVGDLYRLYLTAKQDKIDFNLTFIPKSFSAPHHADFDRNYMRSLFDFGFVLAAKGNPWVKTPPGITG